jgi:hypothetical protein
MIVARRVDAGRARAPDAKHRFGADLRVHVVLREGEQRVGRARLARLRERGDERDARALLFLGPDERLERGQPVRARY